VHQAEVAFGKLIDSRLGGYFARAENPDPQSGLDDAADRCKQVIPHPSFQQKRRASFILARSQCHCLPLLRHRLLQGGHACRREGRQVD
jgi:hypothetical protein